MSQALQIIDIAALATIALRFQECPYDPAFLAYALSDPRARLVVDSPDHPSIAILVPARTSVGFISGDASKWNLEYTQSLCRIAAADALHPLLILSVPNKDWRHALTNPGLIKSWHVPRVDYSFVGNIPDKSTYPASTEFQLRPLNDDLVERVRHEADLEFDSTLFRGMEGFGYAAMHDERIASVAWSPSIAGWTEIAVATAENYRRRGAARLVGAAVLIEALRRSLLPHVTTDQRNLSARKWAMSLGFGNEIPHEWVVLQLKNP